jgi:hypothetical protein
MVGGIGHDIYSVDTAATSNIVGYSKNGYPIYFYLPGDEVIENLNAGSDTVLASISYALPDNVEDLYLTGTDDLSATATIWRTSCAATAAPMRSVAAETSTCSSAASAATR